MNGKDRPLDFLNQAVDEDLRGSLAWHEKELRKTEADFGTGKIEMLDWEAAKEELRGRFD
jgi:hypothetical protein